MFAHLGYAPYNVPIQGTVAHQDYAIQFLSSDASLEPTWQCQVAESHACRTFIVSTPQLPNYSKKQCVQNFGEISPEPVLLNQFSTVHEYFSNKATGLQ